MNEIEINVQPRYVAGQSDVYRDRYAFNYVITICNRSNDVITLRQRFWEITDGHGATEPVGHSGLIEEQPVLYPGEAYEYNSGSQLCTPWGSIEGAYEFEDSIGERFYRRRTEARIQSRLHPAINTEQKQYRSGKPKVV